MQIKRRDLKILIENYLLQETLYDLYKNAGMRLPSKAARRKVGKFLNMDPSMIKKIGAAAQYGGAEGNRALEKAILDYGGIAKVIADMTAPAQDEQGQANLEQANEPEFTEEERLAYQNLTTATGNYVKGFVGIMRDLESVFHNKETIKGFQDLDGFLAKLIDRARTNVKSTLKKVKEQTPARRALIFRRGVMSDDAFLGNSTLHAGIRSGNEYQAFNRITKVSNRSDFEFQFDPSLSQVQSEFKYLPPRFADQNEVLENVYRILTQIYDNPVDADVLDDNVEVLIDMELDVQRRNLEQIQGFRLFAGKRELVQEFTELIKALENDGKDILESIRMAVDYMNKAAATIKSMDAAAQEEAELFLTRHGIIRHGQQR